MGDVNRHAFSPEFDSPKTFRLQAFLGQSAMTRVTSKRPSRARKTFPSAVRSCNRHPRAAITKGGGKQRLATSIVESEMFHISLHFCISYPELPRLMRTHDRVIHAL